MKLKLLSYSIILTWLIAACKKSDSVHDTPPGTPQDTLAPGWTKITLPDPDPISDIFFINNTGYVVSAHDAYKSINGGGTWTKLFSIPANGNNFFSTVAMGSETNAMLVIQPNTILVTQDGGTSFDTTILSDISVSNVFYLDASTAIAVGNSTWKTTDAGAHWTKISTFPHIFTNRYFGLQFLDATNGWATHSDGLYKTNDGGLSWQSVDEGSQMTASETNNLFFTNADHGLISDFHSVAVTKNGGSTWTVTLSNDGNFYHGISFLNDNLGYVTDVNHIRKTTDGGNTWTTEVVLQDYDFVEIFFTDANHGWAAGTNGLILRYEK